MKNAAFWSYLFVFLCSIALGFFAGRKSITTVEKTVHIKDPAITETIPVPTPVSEEKPDSSMLPLRRDTAYINNYIYVRELVDTAAIIADYELRRRYEFPLFDNQYGRLDVSLNTQYNRLGDMSYTFVPIRTVQYVQVRRVWQPFVSASYSTFNIAGIGGGMFYNKLGVEYQWQYGNNRSGHQLGLKWKF